MNSVRDECSEKQTMRFLMITAVSVFALASGAFAQTDAQAPARPVAAQPSTPTQDDIERLHPDWFTEYGIPYRPCPCSVIFPNGRHACLGLP
jgi:hypothetical protein